MPGPLPARSLLPPGLRLALVAVLLGVATACGLPRDDAPHWTDHLVADSPCYRVDIGDGIDETDTTELDELFGCLNAHGHFDALVPTGTALEGTTRGGASAQLTLAALLNGMILADIDPFAVSGVLLDALRAPDRPVDGFLDLALELLYGKPADEVRSGEVDLGAPAALRSGVLVPLAPAFAPTVTGLLDDDLDTASWAGDVIASADTKRWVRSFGSLLEATDPAVRRPVRALVPHLGEVLLAARSPENDIWSPATGDSLKDLLHVWYMTDEPVLAAISADAARILEDDALVAVLEQRLVQLHGQGHLARVAPQLVWMTEVDSDGAPLPPGGDSSLHAFVRLLAETNEPMECSLDLWITDLDFTFGNLAVAVLELLAGMDADAVQASAGILSLLTDNLVAEWMLHEAVDLGICPTLSHQVIDDLGAVDVMAEDEAYDLLVVFLAALDAFANGPTNHLPGAADLFEELYLAGGLQPLEEVVRDLGRGPLVASVVDMVPVLADPAAHGIRAGDEPPVDLRDAIGLLAWGFAVDPDLGQTGLERMRPLWRPLLTHPGTWEALGHAATLMVDDTTQTGRLLELVPPLLAVDPDLVLLDQLGPVLAQRELARPTLEILETPGILDALAAAEPTEGQLEVPFAWLGRLVVGGTLEDLLALVDLLIDAF